MSNYFPRERVLEELRALREATQALHRRLDALIGDLDGDTESDPRVVEIARRAIAELRAKQRTVPMVRNVQQPPAAAPSSPRSERKPRGPRRPV